MNPHAPRMIRMFFVALVLLIGTGQGAGAQNRHEQTRQPEVGPIQMLLDARAELQLTPAQIARLERVDTEMDSLNQPLVAQMSAIRKKIRELGSAENMTPEHRARFEAYLAEARPVMEKIQQNNWNAMRQVGEILSTQQKEMIAQQLRQSNDTTRERNARFPRFPGRGN